MVDKEGYILTNAHVVDESGQRASSVTVVFNKGGSETQRVTGQLVGVDVGSDVAVIKVDPSEVDLKPLPLGDSDKVVVGESVVAIGNPLGYDFSITSGIVSATGRSLQAPNGQTIPNGIQTDAAINQGNSGGPLIDGQGKVIGINEQIASSGGGNDGLGFAVPINTAIRSLEQLKANGKVTYAWMGVSLKTLTSDIAGMLNMQSQGGALVEQVSPGSPAAKAGIKGGTKTVTVQGEQFVDRRRRHRQGRHHGDHVGRRPHRLPRHQEAGRHDHGHRRADGKTQDLSVTLAERPEQPLTAGGAAPCGRRASSSSGPPPTFSGRRPTFFDRPPRRGCIPCIQAVAGVEHGCLIQTAPRRHPWRPQRRTTEGRLLTLDARMQALLPIVRGLAEMFGPDCEVVLHDVRRLPHSIVAIENGAVSGRTVGDVPTDRMLRNLRNTDETQDVRLYISSHDGKILKSLAVTLRDEDGEPYGLLGLNYDISEVVQAQRTLANFTAVGRLGSGAAPEAGEIFAGDIRDVVAAMVTKAVGEMGKTPAAMTREEKMEVVKRLEERGAFLVKRSAEQVAEALDLSRYTIFAYLKEIRRGDCRPARTGGVDQ